MRRFLLSVLFASVTLAAVVVCFAAAPEPVLLSNKALGGGPLNANTPGVAGGVGLNNIGLLVRTWGTVTYVDSTNQFFYIDDGSKLQDGWKKQDGTPTIGVRVSYKDLAPGNTFTAPNIGDRVAVTGISSTTQITVGQETRIIPTLRPRRNEDKTPY